MQHPLSVGRKPETNNAPIIKGPLYSEPAVATATQQSRAVLEALNCSDEAALPCPQSNAATTIEFVNAGGEKVDIYWLDIGGQRRLWGNPLEPGHSNLQNTFVGHNWLVADSQGHSIAIFRANAKPGKATVELYPD